MKKAEAEFNKAMNALLLEVDESIVNDIRQKADDMKTEHAINFYKHEKLFPHNSKYYDKYVEERYAGWINQ